VEGSGEKPSLGLLATLMERRVLSLKKTLFIKRRQIFGGFPLYKRLLLPFRGECVIINIHTEKEIIANKGKIATSLEGESHSGTHFFLGNLAGEQNIPHCESEENHHL